MQQLRSAGLLLLTLSLTGCASPEEKFGRTWYIDGAGNWGWGTKGVQSGLRAAGYNGDIEAFPWTTSFNPIVDQVIPLGPRLRAKS